MGKRGCPSSPTDTRRGIPLNRARAAFAGADTNDIRNGGNEDFSVTDLAALGRFTNGLDSGFYLSVVDNNVDLHFRYQINDVFGAAIEFSMAFLAAEPFDFQDRETLHADLIEGLLYVIELERPNDGLDLFQGVVSSLLVCCSVNLVATVPRTAGR